jgi:Transposase zinc-ribbon domain/ISXO2-like transposase domain
MRPEYPRSLHEFRKVFTNEAACRLYLARSRWPEGFRYPRCQQGEALELPSRLLWRCRACGYDTSVTAGTVLHRTRVPLTQWFWAAYLVSTQTPGFSALQLQRQLGIRRYETAWAMLQKLRCAMVRPEQEPRKDQVEVDETYIGGPEAGLRGGRHVLDKAIVVGAVEVRGKASGRARLQVVPDVSARSLTGFVSTNVAIIGERSWSLTAGEATIHSPSRGTGTDRTRYPACPGRTEGWLRCAA